MVTKYIATGEEIRDEIHVDENENVHILKLMTKAKSDPQKTLQISSEEVRYPEQFFIMKGLMN